jgi:hypothetical protein
VGCGYSVICRVDRAPVRLTELVAALATTSVGDPGSRIDRFFNRFLRGATGCGVVAERPRNRPCLGPPKPTSSLSCFAGRDSREERSKAEWEAANDGDWSVNTTARVEPEEPCPTCGQPFEVDPSGFCTNCHDQILRAKDARYDHVG